MNLCILRFSLISCFFILFFCSGSDLPSNDGIQVYPQDRVVPVGANTSFCCIMEEGKLFVGIYYGTTKMNVTRLSRRTYATTAVNQRPSHNSGSNVYCRSNSQQDLSGTVVFVGCKLNTQRDGGVSGFLVYNLWMWLKWQKLHPHQYVVVPKQLFITANTRHTVIHAHWTRLQEWEKAEHFCQKWHWLQIVLIIAQSLSFTRFRQLQCYWIQQYCCSICTLFTLLSRHICILFSFYLSFIASSQPSEVYYFHRLSYFPMLLTWYRRANHEVNQYNCAIVSKYLHFCPSAFDCNSCVYTVKSVKSEVCPKSSDVWIFVLSRLNARHNRNKSCSFWNMFMWIQFIFWTWLSVWMLTCWLHFQIHRYPLILSVRLMT